MHIFITVKIAKDQNIEDLPEKMNLNSIAIANEDLAEQFANMFEKKINDIASTTSINDTVYNGSRKITEEDKNFMSTNNIRNDLE